MGRIVHDVNYITGIIFEKWSFVKWFFEIFIEFTFYLVPAYILCYFRRKLRTEIIIGECLYLTIKTVIYKSYCDLQMFGDIEKAQGNKMERLGIFLNDGILIGNVGFAEDCSDKTKRRLGYGDCRD